MDSRACLMDPKMGPWKNHIAQANANTPAMAILWAMGHGAMGHGVSAFDYGTSDPLHVGLWPLDLWGLHAYIHVTCYMLHVTCGHMRDKRILLVTFTSIAARHKNWQSNLNCGSALHVTSNKSQSELNF
jgi:hypothetical protein